MAKARIEDYPTPKPGTTAHVIADLLARDTRSARRISIEAGLAGDAIRNIRNLKVENTRAKTLEALAKSFGVDVEVLAGRAPIPEAGPSPDVPDVPDVTQPGAPASRSRRPSMQEAPRPSDTGRSKPPAEAPVDARKALRDAVRHSFSAAVGNGLDPSRALHEVTMTAILAAVSAGMDGDEVMQVIASISGG